MMSFLTNITGFFMNFELLSILIDYVNQKKGGDEVKKNLQKFKVHKTSHNICLYSSNLSTFWLKIKQFWPFEEGDSGQVLFKLAQWFQR
jgi:hypothetical protein